MPRRITSGGAASPQWSPNSNAIAYVGSGALQVVAPDGSRNRVLLRTPFEYGGRSHNLMGMVNWSPDGRTIYLRTADPRSAFWAMPADGGAPRPLVVFDDPSVRAPRPEFAIDGRRIYFTIANRQADIRVAPIERR